MKITRTVCIILSYTLVLTGLIGCGQTKVNHHLDESSLKDSASIELSYPNLVFCLPSPHRVTKYFLDNNLSFQEELILKSDNRSGYLTNFHKALHIGIYGTNLGYQIIFYQERDSMALFLQVKNLANSLGLLDAIDKESLQKIENRHFDPDTILHFIANSYRDVNTYAQSNNKQITSALIIAGGWIESFYLLTEMQKINENKNLEHLIAEHKFALDNLIKVLSPYYKSDPQLKELTDKLVNIAYDLDAVEHEYKYIPSQNDKDKMFTIVKSKSVAVLEKEQLYLLNQKIKSIRDSFLLES